MEYLETEHNEWEIYKRGLTKYHSAPKLSGLQPGERAKPQMEEQDCFSRSINTLLSEAKTKKEKKPILKLLGGEPT